MILVSSVLFFIKNIFLQIELNSLKYHEVFGFQAWVQGILFVLFLYHFLFFFQNKNRMFLYYSAFVFCLLVYFVHYIPEMFYIPDISHVSVTLFYGIQFLAYFFYICYVREVLNTKNLISKWDAILQLAKKILLIFIVIISISSFFLSTIEIFTLVVLLFYLVTLFATVNYFIFYRFKGIPVKLLIIGSVVYLILANVSLVLSIRIAFYNVIPKYNPIIFMQIGAIIEGLIFALIVGYKFNEIERKKRLAQIQLLNKSIEASELKVTALKAQMNPHFIFNVLNSINNFILKNEKELASDYLTKFAKLVRVILKNSSQATVSLKEELDTIKTYVNLERLRVEDGFDLIITNDQNLDLNQIEIPPLSLQPYVENAIWHGLYSKEGKEKKIEISISSRLENALIIIVKDNGIGREASSRLNLEVKKSLGTKITKERIKMIYPNSLVEIKDVHLNDNQDVVSGTAVSIIINGLPNL
ncbi:sensor histidine kinase [Aquimarina algicola]|uniref:Signal transduction histidine kinase internal region domain-containing protein n=1 Tax=Aquimarina algicola TaxID=2589995 RepID=A0A504J9V8_9FLAO|nr:histidine kinase [Aquimarina algicola]TPN84648.1 hypothetical protein FHK87_17105 [Aquimarina algicola]